MTQIYRVGVLLQNLVIAGYTDKENTSRDIFKAMYPFASFRSLPSDVTDSNGENYRSTLYLYDS